MFTAYVAITLATAALNGLAALGNFLGLDSVREQADRNLVPQSWRYPLGTLLAAGAGGLLAGFAVPVLGTLAAAGLVLYFVGAFGAHLRARYFGLGPWAMYFALAVAALGVNVAHHGLG